jgi:undecaprenyl pyrophosphate synthase
MMNITVLPIILADAASNAPLSKVMNERLKRLADELQNLLDNKMKSVKTHCDELVIYISYNSNYTIRWKIVNDVTFVVEDEVAKHCAALNYIVWKGTPIYTPNANKSDQ